VTTNSEIKLLDTLGKVIQEQNYSSYIVSLKFNQPLSNGLYVW